MSRSEYSYDCETINLWRGAVESSIRGKRGQALLIELEAALVALPEKKLCSEFFANPETGAVCALGAVALKRRLDSGMEKNVAIKEINDKFPEDDSDSVIDIQKEFNISDALAREITYVNDEAMIYPITIGGDKDEKRYIAVLNWVRENIKKVEP